MTANVKQPLTSKAKQPPGQHRREPRAILRRAASRALLYAVLLFVAAIVILPILYTFVSGFRSTGDIASAPIGWPDLTRIVNFQNVLGSGLFWGAFALSSFIALVTVTLTLLTASLVAYVLARLEFRGKGAMFTLFTLGLLFPSTVMILPLYLLLNTLGLLNNPWGVILPQAAFQLPTSIIILRPYFRSIPAEIEDAATLDGCTHLAFFWRILLPMSRPALSTVAVLTTVVSWNAYLLPLVVFTTTSQSTLPLAVRNYSTQYSQDTAMVLAFASLAMLPALVLYLFAERQIVAGLGAGAVKG